MIKSIPGYLNYFILWAIYFAMTVGVNYAISRMRQAQNRRAAKKAGWLMTPSKAKWHEHVDWLFCFVITAVYCGGYMAKWRFWDEGWHFW